MDQLPALLHHWPLPAIAAVLTGVLILAVPRVLNYAVAAYLLLVGIHGLLMAFAGQPFAPQAVIALVAGVLILIRPNLLSYVVGIYLILIGLLGAGLLRP
ncbi:hypothetical protein AY586_02210 [Marichromatium gracile]|uniref:DUF3096 family protein n=2 Tax=Marichromatium gracile TaxID=1048 RepID=A0ABR5VGW4_MARGR|nr:hypothetical protein AY586_02210 [Marichromatium gracile]